MGRSQHIINRSKQRVHDDLTPLILIIEDQPLIRAGILSDIEETAVRDVRWDPAAITSVSAAVEASSKRIQYKVVVLDVSESEEDFNQVSSLARLARSLDWLLVVGISTETEVDCLKNFDPLQVTVGFSVSDSICRTELDQVMVDRALHRPDGKVLSESIRNRMSRNVLSGS